MRRLARGLLISASLVILVGCAHGRVPIGGVVDWYRPSESTPVPDGYMIADGSLVTDPASPLVNRHLPDLRSKFVRGAASPSEVGVAGGSASHSHALALAPVNTSDVAELEHRHQWARFVKASNSWSTQSGNDEVALVNWGDGLDSEGSGIYPLAFTASTLANVPDTVYLTTTQQDGLTVHHHQVTFPPGAATASSQSEPPYVTLLKILRIR